MVERENYLYEERRQCAARIRLVLDIKSRNVIHFVEQQIEEEKRISASLRFKLFVCNKMPWLYKIIRFLKHQLTSSQ